MKYKVICVGNLSKVYLKDAVQYYMHKEQIEIIEVKESFVHDEQSQSHITQALQEEGERILKHILPDDYVVALAIEGKPLSSLKTMDNKTYCFIIGGSYGLSKQVYQRSNCRMSISALTFPHQLMRLVLMDFITMNLK